MALTRKATTALVAAGRTSPSPKQQLPGIAASSTARERASLPSRPERTSAARGIECPSAQTSPSPPAERSKQFPLPLAVNGEPLVSATAVVTPAAFGDYGNIFVSANVDVPRGCCLTVAAENISGQAINVANANMIVERVA